MKKFVKLLFVLLIISCNSNEIRKVSKDNFKKSEMQEKNIFYFLVLNGNEFEEVDSTNKYEIANLLIDELYNPSVFYEMNQYIQYLSTHSDIIDHDFVMERFYSTEKELYKIKSNKNNSKEDLMILQNYYNLYLKLSFFQKIWFLEPKLSFSKDYLEYVSYGEIPKLYYNKKNDNELYSLEKYQTFEVEEILNRKLILSWLEDKQNVLIQDYFYQKMLELGKSGEGSIYQYGYY
ncbi:MAG: hypothetical protein N4A45_12780 [Flavobacteriales bacterium]|jgi:hypothetical protein|nr:hypothetical protein [Flavobacteriales bacterium]